MKVEKSLGTIVTFGTFDLFHIGHVRLLERARALGDRLIVGVSTDDFNFRKKGKYPIYPQEERRAIIDALRCVDQTFYEESLELKRSYLKDHKAGCLIMGNDWAGRFDEFRDICDVVYLERTTNISTSEIEAFIQSRSPHEPVWLRRTEAK